MSNKNDHDIYIIPPNFIESGTFFGGMFRARNVIEAGILAFAIGVPVFMFVPFGLTTRIIILCLTALPAALVALIGISGESLSEFLIIFLKYLRNRRIVGGDGQQPNEQAPPMKRPGRHLKQRAPKEKESRPPKRRRSGESDFPAEFDEVRSYEIREKLRPKKKPKKELSSKKAKKKTNKRKEKARPPKRPAHIKEQPPTCLNPVADYLPIEKIQNGIIYTKDHRYVKVVEVVPINFMLRSAREQRNIIYSFVSYLKISPVKLQIKVLTRRADINRHLDTVRREMAQEKNKQCRLMQEDYLSFVQQIGAREAVTRRFFLIFEYEPWNNTRRSEQEEEAIQSLQSAVHTASNYLRQCGKGVYRSQKADGAGKPAKKRIALTMTQQKNFLRFISKSPMYSHWLPVMVVLLGTGLRVGECTGLTKNDVDLENNTISVNHNLIYRVIDGEAGFHITTPKTASGTRTIPILYPQVAEQLRALIEVMDALYPEDLVMNGYHGFLFRNRSGYFLSAHNINRAIERISIAYNAEEMDQAELEDREPNLLPHFSVHNLRHTFCTRLCEKTNDIKFIQQVMGHADFSTTMDIYTHITQESMKEKAEVIKDDLVLM